MKTSLHTVVCLSLLSFAAAGQQYSITTVAGADPVGNGRPATTVPLLGPSSVFGDRLGNLYIADALDDRIRKVDPSGIMTTIAGNGLGGLWGDGGPATQAGISGVRGIAVDSLGNVYLADSGNHCVRKIDVAGRITTIASGDQLIATGEPGLALHQLNIPRALALDRNGNLYVPVNSSSVRELPDGMFEFRAFSRILRIEPSGAIRTVAGFPVTSFVDGVPASSFGLGFISGLALDAAGNIFVSDDFFSLVRKIGLDGNVRTIAGNGKSSYAGDGGSAMSASLNPAGIALDSAGNLYVADGGNSRIRKIDASSGMIGTVAGNGQYGFGGDGGPARSAMLAYPSSVWVDGAGNIFIADRDNGRVRQVRPDGTILTVAGTSVGDGGPATSAFVGCPRSVAADSSGSVYIADTEHHRIRQVKPTGEIQTIAGTGYAGFDDGGGRATQARLNLPIGVAADAAGIVYVADSDNYRIRKVTRDGAISTIAGTGARGFSGDGSPADSAKIGYATSVAVGAAGSIYFTDTTSYRIRKITSGTITSIAGNGKKASAGDGGPATSAQLHPLDICVDRLGNIYVADSDNNRIRKIDSAGVITTVAGTGVAGWKGDGGLATSALLSTPTGVIVDGNGNLFIADGGNNVVRRVTPAGVISTIAGTGRRIFAGDRTSALSVDFNPYRLALDERGNLLVVDWLNGRVRKLTPQVATTLTLVSGGSQTGTTGQKLPQPLLVRVVDSAGVPMPGVTVTFVVTSGSATLASAKEVTGADGVASTTVTLGATAGEVTVTATVAGLPVATFKLTAKAPVPKPVITSGGVVGASLSVPPVQALSPNGLVTILGENLAPAGTSRQVVEGDYVDGKLPTKFAGVCVFVGEKAAPILAVQPKLVTFQTPRLEAPGTVEVRVAVNCGTADEVRSGAEPVPYQSAAPEFVYFVQSPDGKNPIKAINGATGENIGTPGLLAEGTFVPAKPGDVLTLHAIGLGLTEPQFAAGEIPADRAPIIGAVEVRIGEITLAASDILYAGVAPWSPGLYLLEIRLPADVADGDQAVRISVDGIASPEGGYIRVER